MNSESLETKALRIENKAKEVLSRIRGAISDTGIEDACYAVRARVKPEGRLVEKVGRKRETKRDYKLESITDVIGIRLITLFRIDLPKIMTMVIDIISHDAEIKPNPVKKGSLEEVIIYNSELESSPFNLLIKETLDQRNINFTTKSSKEGYSSIHIVCRVSPNVTDCSSVSPDYQLPIEIQIRTVFEDAWGEIDHKYGYLARSGKELTLEQNQAHIGPHLRVLKQFTDACASYADTIKEMCSEYSTMSTKAGKILSVESDEDVLRRFEQLGVGKEFIEQYSAGRALRDKCALNTQNKQERAQCYLDAAQYFSSIAQQCESSLAGEGRKLYWYYVVLNSAFCLLSANISASIESAAEIYLDLTEKYPNFPLVKFRLGQAYSKLGRIDDSIRLYEDVLQEIKPIADESQRRGSWEDNLPLPDYTHISKILPKLLGYQYWEKGAFRTDPANRAEILILYRKAHDVTLMAYRLSPDNADLANNLAFYAVEYLAIENGDTFSNELRAALPTYQAAIEEAAKAPDADAMLLDTLLQLYIFSENAEAARTLAPRVADALASDANVPDTIARVIQARVLKVLMKPMSS
ncbi:RelA_SpoT domain-containing protein [Burkholderia diffusa]|uniref:RelA/SpoT domain-containing protein n=1 Tax=Burkholderia diffusa TaxID=488732 RepID=UPI001CB4E221|nr:RelA/SpoT domain-containing protein [Burkholderia diffusa]CAG9251380.1 RelA_SpoT domain-containing protein [Burkholderia diffusa]